MQFLTYFSLLNKKSLLFRSYEGEVSFIESQDTFDEENKKCKIG